MPPEEIRKRVDNALKAVGMYEYRGHEPHKLSGGQKQRVAIAGIIAMLPECIVLDEPTAMLDPRGRKEVMDTCIKLNREMGMTVVFITHFMEEAVLANRVIVMDDAKIILDGTPKQVFIIRSFSKKSVLTFRRRRSLQMTCVRAELLFLKTYFRLMNFLMKF